MRQYKYPAVAICFLISIAISGYKGYQLGVSTMQADLLQAQESARNDERQLQRMVSAVSTALHSELGKVRIVNKTINRAIEREIHTQHVFSNPDCNLPEPAFRLLSNKIESYGARDGTRAASAMQPDTQPR